MSAIRKLASQTAIYGLSSIIGRFLNYLLVPLHTAKGVFDPAQYGIITEMYAYVAFLVIFLTYGMETAFFRFYNKNEFKKENVYTTAILSLLTTSALFIFCCYLFQVPVADWLRYPNNSEYVFWFAIIVGLDAVSSLPLAKLRAQNKALKFAVINLTSVAVNIFLNLFFLAYCLPMYKAGHTNFLVETFYNPEIGVGYVFIANLIASIVKFALLLPDMIRGEGRPQFTILEKMLLYALPLLFAGLAGMVNETIDRILLKRMLIDDLGETATMTQIGIYGAVYKISILMTLFIQAYRYAAEPFFFAQEKESNARQTYAHVMNYFVIVCSVIFLGVMLYLDLIRYFIPNPAYWEGLKIVPVLLFANAFLGIYYNQSIWYKLTGHTLYGALLALFGAVITIVLNVIWIPVIGYVGSAWATFICYGSMMIASYFLGQRYYPVPYNIFKILFYLLGAFGFYYASTLIVTGSMAVHLSVNTLIFLLFAGVIYFVERPGKKIVHENQNH